MSGGPHGRRDRNATDPDLQRFLAGDGVRTGGERPVLETTPRGSDGYAAHRPSMPARGRGRSLRRPSDGIGALVTVRDEVVVHVERPGPGVVPVHPQRSRSIADGGLQQIVGDPGALVRLTNVDGVELPFGGCVAVPG